MRAPFLFLFIVVAALAPLHAGESAIARVVAQFDSDWRFAKGDTPGAEGVKFDDGDWQAVSVPHDWSIEGPFDRANPAKGLGAWLPTGVGWYRKHFILPEGDENRRVFIDFDGVMTNSEVWINGFSLGKRPNGYVSFRYELTGHLNPAAAGPNVLAVRVDTLKQPASRWYAGSGIYRHVRLVVTEPVHLDHWGVVVNWTPANDATQGPGTGRSTARVRVRSTVVNQSEKKRQVTLRTTITAPDGRTFPPVESTEEVEVGMARDCSQEIAVENAQFWDVEKAQLYRALVQVVDAEELAGVRDTRLQLLDEETVTFGIREARFDAASGFWLNGKSLKIKGVCLHQDGGAFGAAVPMQVWERRLELLRGVGVNAIRTAHNPPAPEFLDLCDRMGFLVVDELFDCWRVGKLDHDYHESFPVWYKQDTRDTIRRDRNHPSVIFYSTGNEILDTSNPDMAKGTLGTLLGIIHAEDPTRPVTQGLWRPKVTHDYENGFADMLDVIGTNYKERDLLEAHQQNPARKIISLETDHSQPAWLAMRDNPAFAGQFLWVGIDYLGEKQGWSEVNGTNGLFNRTGRAFPRAYERQSWWTDKPMVYMTRRIDEIGVGILAPRPKPGEPPVKAKWQRLVTDWTPQEQDAHEESVEVYSNSEEVELVLNGKSLGTQPLPKDASPRKWQVTYEPGTLKAVARNDGKVVATNELRTAGKAFAVKLSADRPKLAAEWDDVCYVTAEIVDENGVPVPDASDLVEFKLTGPGVIAAVDNADRFCVEPFQASKRETYRGQCVAIVKASGTAGSIEVTASAKGLAAASSITIKTTSKGGEN